MDFHMVGRNALIALAAILAPCSEAFAEYPNGPVTIVAPFAAGGTVDQVARELARGLEKKWGVTVLVDNKPGAGNILAATSIAQSKPDGQKLLLATTSISINPSVYKSLPYDPAKDLSSVSYLAASPNVLVVRDSLHVNSLPEFIALAKSSATPLRYASVGKGSAHHFCMELLQIQAKIKLVHIPYKGVAPAVSAVLNDEVPLYCSDIPGAVEPIREGKFKPLAVTSAKRLSVLPDVPTMAEAGLPNFNNAGYVGIMAAGATPRELRETINRAIQDVIKQPEFRQRFAALGYDMVGGTVDEFADFIKSDTARYGEIAKEANIEVQ
ncbi:MAG: Bug family tripartite tricarboxylate transporter substrate binding protein [Bradyrhizobium sp.]